MYHSHNEIFTQGESLQKTWDFVTEQKDKIRDFFASADYDEIVFVACGSSYWLSMSACMTWQAMTNKRCSAIKSGDILLEPDYYSRACIRPLFIIPSRSGRTSETLLALDLLQKWYAAAPVFALVVYEDSQLEARADFSVKLPWANEISICQSRSLSNIYTAAIMAADAIAGDGTLTRELAEYIADFETYSPAAETLIKQIMAEMPNCKALISLGAGRQYGLAIAGAYVTLEMSQLPCHYYGLLEYRHGPIVLADSDYLISIIGGRHLNGYDEKLATDARKSGAKVLGITSGSPLAGVDYKAVVPKAVSKEVLSLYGVFILQGFAYYKACALGVNPDAPGELTPFIEI